MINQTKFGRNFSIDQNSASVTICNHMYDEAQSLLQYLYDDGKCGSICRGNEIYTSMYFSSIPLLYSRKWYFHCPRNTTTLFQLQNVSVKKRKLFARK